MQLNQVKTNKAPQSLILKRLIPLAGMNKILIHQIKNKQLIIMQNQTKCLHPYNSII